MKAPQENQKVRTKRALDGESGKLSVRRCRALPRDPTHWAALCSVFPQNLRYAGIHRPERPAWHEQGHICIQVPEINWVSDTHLSARAHSGSCSTPELGFLSLYIVPHLRGQLLQGHVGAWRHNQNAGRGNANVIQLPSIVREGTRG